MGVIRKRHPHRLMYFLWKSGFKVYVTMVVVLMDKINLPPTDLCRGGPGFIYFRDRESPSSFFIYVTRKYPLSAFKFLGSKYELYIRIFDECFVFRGKETRRYGSQIGQKYFILEDIKNNIWTYDLISNTSNVKIIIAIEDLKGSTISLKTEMNFFISVKSNFA